MNKLKGYIKIIRYVGEERPSEVSHTSRNLDNILVAIGYKTSSECNVESIMVS